MSDQVESVNLVDEEETVVEARTGSIGSTPAQLNPLQVSQPAEASPDVPPASQVSVESANAEVAPILDEPNFLKRLWRRLPPIIKPFALDSDINWEEVSTESQFLTLMFKDRRVAPEFARFAHRDLVGAVYAAVALFGTLFFPLAGLSPDNQLCPPTLYLVHALFWVLTPMELALHAFFENTVRVAYIRRGLQFGITSIGTLATTICPFSGLYLHCREYAYPFRSIGLKDPNLTSERIGIYCRNSISAFPIVTTTLIPVLFAFPPHLAIIPLLLNWLLEILARFVAQGYREDPESATEIAVKALVSVSVGLLIYVIVVIRYHKMVVQFKATIDVEIASRKARKVEEEVDTLLCAMLPSSALVRISSGERVLDWTADATVLFSDMVAFTAWSTTRTPRQVADMLNKLCIAVDQLALDKGVEKVKTIGDAYWAVSGLPDRAEDHAQRICDFGNGMLDELEKLNDQHAEWEGVELRIGVHSGPLGGGILGIRQLSYEVFGETSAIAEQIELKGLPSRVCVSEATLYCLRIPAETLPKLQISDSGDDGNFEGTLQVEIFVLFREQINARRSRSGSVLSSGASEVSSAVQEVVELNPSVIPSSADDGGPPPRSPSHSMGSWQSDGSLQIKTNSAPRSRKAKISRKLRQQFLASRTAMYMAAIGDTASREELHGKFSARKWGWFLLTFADPLVEAEYQRFVWHPQLSLRQAARVCTVALIVLLCICVWISGAPFGLAATILFPLAGVVGLLDAASTFVTDRIPIPAQTVWQHASFILMFFAAGMVPPGKSISTNDITYLHTVATVLVGIGNCGPISALHLFLANMMFFVPAVVYLVWETIPLFTNILFLVQSNAILAFALFCTEKRFRQQYLDHSVESVRHAEQHRRNAEQYALLASVVPEYVVPDLMAWFATAMDPDKAIVSHYPKVSVAFVRLYPTGLVQRSDSNISSPGQPPTSLVNNWSIASPSDTMRMVSSDSGVFLSSSPQSPLVHSNTLPPTSTRRVGAIPGAAPLSEHLLDHSWLLSSHHAVDRVLALFKAIDKIKTIGDVVMIAGPFTDQHTPSAAAAQLLRAICTLRATVCMDLKAGLHSGELVAGVLGTNRLCFDIFGDAVNVASRAMTKSAKGVVSATSQFLETLSLENSVELPDRATLTDVAPSTTRRPATPANGLCPGVKDSSASGPAHQAQTAVTKRQRTDSCFQFGSQISVEAKGKGFIWMRELLGQ